MRFLQVQQPAFAPQSAAVAAELAAFVHHAVAWNDDGDAVETVGASDGANRGAIAEGDRDVLIRARFSIGDFEKLGPHALFEDASHKKTLQLKDCYKKLQLPKL